MTRDLKSQFGRQQSARCGKTVLVTNRLRKIDIRRAIRRLFDVGQPPFSTSCPFLFGDVEATPVPRRIAMQKPIRLFAVLLALSSFSPLLYGVDDEAEFAGAQTVSFYGYADCIQLSNETTQVVLCPAAGGRVLQYSLHGRNVLYLPPGDEGWKWDGSSGWSNMNAGRFDIGPEQMVPQRNLLWQGQWRGEILGDRKARLVSPVDPGPGVSLERTFELSADNSKLTCQQTIINASDHPVEYCHWSRTFAKGGGICIVPLSKPGRFPEGFVRYDPPGKMLNMSPEDDKVVRKAGFLLIGDHPRYPKLGFDSLEGWLAYHAPNDLLFVKTFPTYPMRAYNEVAGLTISIWYPDRPMVELEPIGPKERLEKRGDRASFTETWFLVPHPTPILESVEPEEVARIVGQLQVD
jgi:hypothetical protein